jgi:hypothetical protein
MATNRYFIPALLLLTLLLNLNFHCRKDFSCDETKHSFEIGIRAYPNTEEINVNDTLWLEINTPDILRDKQTGTLIDYSGVENLGATISFQKLEGSAFTGKAVNNFQRILLKGKEVTNDIDPALFREFVFEDENGNYQFKMAVVPKDTGVFRITFSNAANVYRKSDRCTKAYFTINFVQTNQHYFFYPDYHGSPDTPSGTYYFQVK